MHHIIFLLLYPIHAEEASQVDCLLLFPMYGRNIIVYNFHWSPLPVQMKQRLSLSLGVNFYL